MSRLTFRTKLYRSNPQVIRYFIIDDSRTIGELVDVVKIVHGIDNNENCRVVRNTATIGHISKISDMFSKEKADDEWKIYMPYARKFGFVYNEKTLSEPDEWIFNLDVIDERFLEDISAGDDEPQIIMSRGFNFHKCADSIWRMNEIQARLNDCSEYFDYGLGTISCKDIRVDFKAINKRLKRQVDEGIKKLKAYTANTEKLEKILDCYKVDNIKECIRYRHFPISYNQRKANLVRDLARYYDTKDFWMNLIKDMGYDEYMNLKASVTSSSYEDRMKLENVHILSVYLLEVYDGKVVWIPQELANFLVEYINENDDKDLIEEKKSRAVESVALRLYGIFHRDVYERLCSIMYPGDEDLKDYWQKWQCTNYNLWQQAGSDFTVSVNAYHRFENLKNLKDFKNADKYYYPSKDEAYDILKNGLAFSEKSKIKLSKALQLFTDFFYDSRGLKEYLCRCIYDAYHCGGDFQEVRNVMNDCIF